MYLYLTIVQSVCTLVSGVNGKEYKRAGSIVIHISRKHRSCLQDRHDTSSRFTVSAETPLLI